MSFLHFLQVEWPFLLCILQVLLCVIAATVVLVKFEARPSAIPRSPQLFRCCSASLHPSWLAAFRAISFLYLLTIWIISFVESGPLSLIFYTQWTFTLLTVFFGLATFISIKELVKETRNKTARDLVSSFAEEETGSFIDAEAKASSEAAADDETDADPSAGLIGYATLIIFQTAAGAAVLTDAVYWFVLVPFVLSSPYFDLTFVNINMHGVNAFFLLVEFFLNDLPFPWFRGAYFVYWTAAYVLFQWIIHGTKVITWWPYPFLEVSTHFAPAWYFSLAFAHLICFIVCLALARAKRPMISYVVSRNARQS